MDGFVNRGNLYRLKNTVEKARRGEKCVIGFLGGSITMGCHTATEDNRYVNRVFAWWKNTFPQAEFELVNAGIGATTSQFGVARCDEDLLSYNPDFVILEFSVNDDNTDFFKETYESCVRKILENKSSPALMIVNNLFYDTGKNSQEIHNQIGVRYSLPIASVRDYVYPRLQNGELVKSELTSDNLHPLDKGHEILAKVITDCLEKLVADIDKGCKDACENLPTPLTLNRYADSTRYQNYSDIAPERNGFVANTESSYGITDVFKNGWLGTKGDSIKFKVEGGIISVQWQRTIKRPAPVAEAVIGGDESKKITLDANFEETWGDLICLTTLLEGGDKGLHTLEIRVSECDDKKIPFNLVSVITADKN